MPGLFAQGLVVQGSVFLRKTSTTGTVDVAEAKIGAQLDCAGSTFDGNRDWALNGQRLQVSGGYIWRNIEVAQGQVYLASAHVGDLVDDRAGWPDGESQL